MKKLFNEPLWQDYSVSAVLTQHKIYVHGKYWFGSMGLTSTSVRLPWFQLFSTETKMNSSNDSAGEKPYQTESNSTCIHVRQVPIFPHGWCSKDCQVGSVVPYFSLSTLISYLLCTHFWLKPVWPQLQGFFTFIILPVFSFLTLFFVYSVDIRDWISFWLLWGTHWAGCWKYSKIMTHPVSAITSKPVHIDLATCN